MDSTKDEKFHFGRGNSGTLNDLQEPKGYHYNDMTYQEARNAGHNNTVGDRTIITNDVSQVKNGESKTLTYERQGNLTTRFTLDNGRNYGVGSSGKLYPENGPKLQQLDKSQTRSLGKLNDCGLSEESKLAVLRENMTSDRAKQVVDIWQENKGKGIDRSKVNIWQKRLDRKSDDTQDKSNIFHSTHKSTPTKGQ